MTVTFYKLSTVGAALILLAGCSSLGNMPFVGQWSSQQANGQGTTEKSGASEACLPEPGSPFNFRKAVLVAGTLGASEQAKDLPGLGLLTSQRLQTHLDNLKRFNVLAMHDASFDSMAPSTAAHVKHLGKEYASQFVVKLEVEDLTVHSSGGWIRKVFSGRAKRNVIMKLYIYGTEYGTLFHSQQYQDTVSGHVLGFPGEGNSVSTHWFDTDLGKKIDEVLVDMSLQINEKLACVPFSTEVTAMRGDNIHINAGFLHGLRPGATLRVYSSNELSEPDSTSKHQDDQVWIKVNTVFPGHSVASVAEGRVGVSRLDIGDVVRAW